MSSSNRGRRATLGVHQRMHRTVAVALAATALAVTACGSAVQAYTTSGQPAAVSRYKTFGVVVPDPEELKENQMRPETLRRLADLSVERMQSLGYQPVAAREADLLLGLSPEAQLYGPLRVVNESSRPDNPLDEKFEGEGTLTVNFVDMHSKQIVLRRVAKARVSSQLGEEQMREIVASVFEGMPPAAN